MTLEKEAIKTIDIQVKIWRDKVNGNTYFSAQVVFNSALPDEEVARLPFQYGDASHAPWVVMREILQEKEGSLWQFCRSRGIILRESSQKALKREVTQWGKEA